MKIGTSNIHNAIKFTVSIAYDAYVDIFYGGLLFHQGRFIFVSKNILLVKHMWVFFLFWRYLAIAIVMTTILKFEFIKFYDCSTARTHA